MTQEGKQASEEEAREFLKKRSEYYGEILPALRILHEHEKLQTELHEFRLRSQMSIIRLAEIQKGQDPNPEKK